MDVEKLMKMNAMVKELQKHNCASSREDAVRQAEGIYNPTGNVVVEDSSGSLLVEQKISAPVNSAPSQPAAAGGFGALEQRRFEMVLEANNKRYDEKIASLTNEILSLRSQLASQVDGLKMELRNLIDNKAQKIVHVVEEKQKVLKTEPKIAHPRQGNFTSDDVSIDKFFYFGAGGPKK